LALSCGDAPVVLTGHNGAGKTNILEAISLLVPGRGLRRAKISEIDRQGQGQPWAMHCIVKAPMGEMAIGTGREAVDPGAFSLKDMAAGAECGAAKLDKRIVKIDGKQVRGQAELSKWFSAIWVTPEFDQLFLDGNSARRKFLDRLVFSFDPAHAEHAQAYEHSMRERNKLLGERLLNHPWLTALERTMAEQGVAMAFARLETIARLNKQIAATRNDFPRAQMQLMGWVEEQIINGASALLAEERFAALLSANRQADSIAGRAVEGVHRSEWQVFHSKKNCEAANCSTGEQKALLLSVVLAQAQAARQYGRPVPVLLLDEVVAHLDATRRAALFHAIREVGAQAWMTGTDEALFEGMRGRAMFAKVNAGKIET